MINVSCQKLYKASNELDALERVHAQYHTKLIRKVNQIKSHLFHCYSKIKKCKYILGKALLICFKRPSESNCTKSKTKGSIKHHINFNSLE